MFEKHKLTQEEAKKLKIPSEFIGKELGTIPYQVIRKMHVRLEDLLAGMEESNKVECYKVISFYISQIEKKK